MIPNIGGAGRNNPNRPQTPVINGVAAITSVLVILTPTVGELPKHDWSGSGLFNI